MASLEHIAPAPSESIHNTADPARVVEGSVKGSDTQFRSFDDDIKENRWSRALDRLPAVLGMLKVSLSLKTPLDLLGEGRQASEERQSTKNVLRVGGYFDLLRGKQFDWLRVYLRSCWTGLMSKNLPASVDSLQLGLSHVELEFGYSRWNAHNHCRQMLDELLRLADENGISRVGWSTMPDDKATRDAIAVASFWSRYHFIKFQIELSLQDPKAAALSLDLSDNALNVQAALGVRTNRKKAQNTFYLMTSNISLARVFLRMFRGQYTRALELEEWVKANYKQSDLRARIRARIAETVCRRSLSADSDNELAALVESTETEVRWWQEHFPNHRLNLRLFFEHTLTLLLRISLHSKGPVRRELLNKLNEKISSMNKLFADAAHRDRDRDPVWAAQIGMLEARAALLRHDLATAKERAEMALQEIDRTPLKLLRIQARIALGVVRIVERNYERALELFGQAERLNREGDFISDRAEFTQPELAATVFLYSARVHIRRDDHLNAVAYFDKYKAIRSEVEHAWIIKRLAPEIEREIMFGIWRSPGEDEAPEPGFDGLTSKKLEIEQASQRLGTAQATKLAKELKISTQTLYNWLKELESNNIMPELQGKGIRLTREQRLEHAKGEIEDACKVVGPNISAIARHLGRSRQSLYNLLDQLEEAGLAPIDRKLPVRRRRQTASSGTNGVDG